MRNCVDVVGREPRKKETGADDENMKGIRREMKEVEREKGGV